MIRLRSLSMLLAVLALVGCGGDDGGGGAPAGGAPTADGAFPVTIRSKFGSATIERRPQRVVTLDNQATDDALALGVVPVGAAKITYVDGGMQAWTAEALRGRPRPLLLDTDSSIPYERIAALRPDLILAPHAYLLDRGAYERLRRIAPTVHFQAGPLADTWQQTMERVGQALGQPQRARELVAKAEGALDAARDRAPAFEGATVTIFNATPDGVYAINDPHDYSLRLMGDLGMRMSPDVAGLKGESGRAVISSERYELLDSDLLIGTSPAPNVLAELEDDSLFSRLRAVRGGRYVSLPIGPATSLAFPSVLSVRYAAREVLPQLERAIGAGA